MANGIFFSTHLRGFSESFKKKQKKKKEKMADNSSTAVIVVVVVVVLLLLLAFFWCGCGSGCSSSPCTLKKSMVPFSAGALMDDTTPQALTNLQYIALGNGDSSGVATFSAFNDAGSEADQFAAAFTRDGQVRKFTVHARLAATTTAKVTVGLYVSPKSADQPLFALVQSAVFDATDSAAYFYSPGTAVSNVKAGDRYVVLVTSDTADASLYLVGGSFEYAQCS
jgi:hypothetical protein